VKRWTFASPIPSPIDSLVNLPGDGFIELTPDVPREQLAVRVINHLGDEVMKVNGVVGGGHPESAA
jgi:hypothetical protein